MVQLITDGANVDEVADAALAAADKAFASIQNDPGFAETAALLTQLAVSAKKPDPAAHLAANGFTKGLDQFRRWYHRRTDDTPLAKWTPEARRLLRQELTWFKKLHDDLAA